MYGIQFEVVKVQKNLKLQFFNKSNYMKKYLLGALALLFLGVFTNSYAQKRKKKSDKPEVIKDSLVLISTEFGDIKFKLYKEIPIHRSNFLKLVNQGTLDSTLFHRVIQNFMIQGGDPASKKAGANATLGDGELGYTLPAEFNPALYHKKGVLAAARQGDDVNPKKSSSACQFYIVQGKTFNDNDLNMMEQRINGQYKQSLFSKIIARPENASLMNRFISNQQAKNQDSLKVLSGLVDKLIEVEPGTTIFKYSENARKDYATIGGTPHLDGNYTVFGEVVSGLEVVDKIAAVQKGQADRPLMDVRMRVKLVLE